jgi:hypothetical protein
MLLGEPKPSCPKADKRSVGPYMPFYIRGTPQLIYIDRVDLLTYKEDSIV